LVPTTLQLYAGESSTGEVVFEEVLAESYGDECYKLLRSPGLVLGIAAGDVFEYEGGGAFRVLKRSGNLAIQIFVEENPAGVERDAANLLKPLGARLDGKGPTELVFSVPVQVGFRRIEEALNTVTARSASAEWFFGNVFDPSDGITPLNWWLDGWDVLH
jgi:hypothetical protein